MEWSYSQYYKIETHNTPTTWRQCLHRTRIQKTPNLKGLSFSNMSVWEASVAVVLEMDAGGKKKKKKKSVKGNF